MKREIQWTSLAVRAQLLHRRRLHRVIGNFFANSVQHRSYVEALSGLGAEIAAQLQEHAFDYLDAPIGRVGAPFSPVPFSPALEKHYVPNAAMIVAEARRMLGA